MSGFIGIDSYFLDKSYVHPKTGQTKSFRSLIGVGVSVRDYDSFKKGYEIAITNTLKRCGIEKEKDVYCNYDFKKIYDKTKMPVHQIFFQEIRPFIESINVVYTLISPKIQMNWMGRLEKELKHELSIPKIGFDKIMNVLNNAFPVVCVWRINEFLKKQNFIILLDHFTVKPCEAWEEVENMPLYVYFSGDKCNALIATADKLIQLINLRLQKNRKFYEYGSFRSVLPEMNNKVYEYSISHRHFNELSFLHPKVINLKEKLKHPIFFILNESGFMDSNDLKNDDKLNYVYNLAHAKEGCVKIFERKEDNKIVEDGDFIVYFTDDGYKFVQMLKGMGKKIQGINLGKKD